jgi:hypothetical protein
MTIDEILERASAIKKLESELKRLCGELMQGVRSGPSAESEPVQKEMQPTQKVRRGESLDCKWSGEKLIALFRERPGKHLSAREIRIALKLPRSTQANVSAQLCYLNATKRLERMDTGIYRLAGDGTRTNRTKEQYSRSYSLPRILEFLQKHAGRIFTAAEVEEGMGLGAGGRKHVAPQLAHLARVGKIVKVAPGHYGAEASPFTRGLVGPAVLLSSETNNAANK